MKNPGFTIVEVMIFLAISGFTFIVAAQFIAGKESQTALTLGMTDVQNEVDTLINNVSSGNYPQPLNANLSCSFINNQLNIIANNNSSSPQTPCVFAGTLVQLNLQSTSYELQTVAGCMYYSQVYRQCGDGTGSYIVPVSLDEEYPQSIGYLSVNKVWKDGLMLSKACYQEGLTSGPCTPIREIGFFSGLPNQSSNSNVLQNGAAPVSVYYSVSSSAHINIANSFKQMQGLIYLCFRGTNNQLGALQIGNSNGGVSYNTQKLLGNRSPSTCAH